MQRFARIRLVLEGLDSLMCQCPDSKREVPVTLSEL